MNAPLSPDLICKPASISSAPLNLAPFLLPDEAFCSQAGRYHVQSGNSTTRQTYLDLFGSAPFSLTAPSAQGLDALADRLSGNQQQNRQYLLLNATLFPLRRFFLGASHTYLPRTLSAGRTPSWSVRTINETKLCLECLAEDFQEHGHRYIHRAHQIPGVDACWRHGTRLLFKCPGCEYPFEQRRIFDLIRAPWEPCSACGLPIWEVDGIDSKPVSEVERDYARFTQTVLQDLNAEVSADVLAQAYRLAALEQGFAESARSKRLDRAAIEESFLRYYGREVLERMDPCLQTGRTSGRFQILTPGATFEVPLQRHLMFAHYLFAGVETLWRYVEAAQTALKDQPAQQYRKRTRSQSTPNRVAEEGASDGTHLDAEKGSLWFYDGLRFHAAGSFVLG